MHIAFLPKKHLISFCFISFIFTLQINAHIMPSGKGTLNIVKDKAYLILSLPKEVFKNQQVEIKSFNSRIKAVFKSKVSIQSSGFPATWDEVLVSPPPKSDPYSKKHEMIIMAVAKFHKTPGVVHLRSQLWVDKSQKLSIKATWTEEKTIIKEEVRDLTLADPEVKFFQPDNQIYFHYFKTGMEHIFFGFDHLVFLIALLAGVAGFWRLILLLTLFTAGHALTFFCGLKGIVPISPEYVEPAIALSIVIFAILHLIKPKIKCTVSALLIFIIGSIHGLGFASSFSSYGSLSTNSLAGLICFNGGIEIAQVIVVVMFSFVFFLIKYFNKPQFDFWLRKTLLVLSVLLGFIWFFERVF